MSTPSVISQRSHRSATERLARVLLAIGIVMIPLHSGIAQEVEQSASQNAEPAARPWTFRLTSGALVATGAQRNSFKDAQLSAAGLSWRVAPLLSVTATFSWARSRVLDVENLGKVDVFNSDLGMEVESKEWSPNDALRLRWFAGAGGGMRSYHYRASAVDATNHPAAFVAVGGDVGVGRVGLRLEARDYASRFTPSMRNGDSETRNDMVISAGLYLKKRRAPQR